jgi:Flp pilus assembly protein TadG
MVALLFFTLIFGIIEFGRLLYTHNALADATRRGARFAVLNPGITEADKTKVRNEVVYGRFGSFDVDGNPTSAPVIDGLTTTMVEVTFQGEDLDNDPTTPDSPFGSNLGSATVRIVGYQFNLTIPVVGRPLTMPDYATTLAAESAGETPADIGVGP